MPSRTHLQALALVAAALVSVSVSVSSEGVESNSDDQQCGLYLAVSSTSTIDETKWGLYAGKGYDSGQQIGYPDLAINILNFQSNTGVDMEPEDEEEASSLLFRTVDFFEQLIWVPIPAGGKFEMEEGRVISAIPGAGVLGGYNPKLTNADWNHTAAYLRDSMGEVAEASHPGRGASTSFYHVALWSKSYIPPGREIFLDFGDNWEEENKEEELEKEDYEKLDETVDKMHMFFKKYEGELDAKAKREIYDFLIRDVMKAATGEGKSKKIADLLPSDPDMLLQVKEKGGTLSYSQPTSQRDLAWLQAHGRCMDNIRPGPSTIPNAGRGAFATRRIKEGGIVAPVPLAQLPEPQALDMHEVGMDANRRKQENEIGEFLFSTLGDEATGKQLLYNYCYGHPDSSLLLFPTGSVVAFINHSKEPNAKMVWSNHPAHQKHWLNLEPWELLHNENMYIGLVMEIVALRDIEEGEEIFIDYGEEWSEAWESHQQHWEQLKQDGEIPSSWPLRALDLNEQHKTHKFKTQFEQEQDPYPENVALKCFAPFKQEKEEERSNIVDGLPVYHWKKPNNEYIFDGDELFDCTITAREKVKDTTKNEEKEYWGSMPFKYTIKRSSKAASDDAGDEEDYDLIFRDVPHYAFTFVDKAASGDQFYPHSFRHYIGIPDDVFPQGPWRDMDQEQQ